MAKKKWEVRLQWTEYEILEIWATDEEEAEKIALDNRLEEDRGGILLEEGSEGDYHVEDITECEEE